MKISEIYRRIERYLRSDDTRLRIVNFQDRASSLRFGNILTSGRLFLNHLLISARMMKIS